MSTERPSPRYSEIDAWQPRDTLEARIDGQFAAVAAVRAARTAAENAAKNLLDRGEGQLRKALALRGQRGMNAA